MICPFCGAEMELGYIQCRDGVTWTPRVAPFAAFSWLCRGAVRLAGTENSIFAGVPVEAYRCADCKKIVISYGKD